MNTFLKVALFLALIACTDLDPKNYPNLKIEILKEGKGEERVGSRDTLKVHYVGRFTNGRVFDSSYKRGIPKRFAMYSSAQIMGWKVGVMGMKVGGKRRVTIPPELAFGKKGKLNIIPPNATLIFDIELLEIE